MMFLNNCIRISCLLIIIVPHRRTHGRLLEVKEYMFWRGTRGPVSPGLTHTRGSAKETTEEARQETLALREQAKG